MLPCHPALPAPTLPRPAPGERWIPAIHGVSITPSLEASGLYNHNGALLGRFCEQAGIPTGVPVPVEAWHLMCEAWDLRVYQGRDREPARQARQAELIAAARALIASLAHQRRAA